MSCNSRKIFPLGRISILVSFFFLFCFILCMFVVVAVICWRLLLFLFTIYYHWCFEYSNDIRTMKQFTCIWSAYIAEKIISFNAGIMLHCTENVSVNQTENGHSIYYYISTQTQTHSKKKTEYKIAHEIHGKLAFCCCCGIRNLYLAWSAFNSDEFLRVTQNKNWRFFLYFLLNFWSNFSLTLGVLIASLSKFWLQICCCALRKN